MRLKKLRMPGDRAKFEHMKLLVTGIRKRVILFSFYTALLANIRVL